MKTLLKTAALAASSLLLTAGLPSCTHKDTPEIRIGVSQCSADDWRSKMNREIELEALLNEGTEVEILSADDSNAKQIEDIRYFARNGFDVIIVAPNEAEAITPVVDSVMRAGIPVIVFDRNVTGSNYTAFQGADNDSIGFQAARYIYSKKGEDARILEIYGNPASTPAQGRHNGLLKGLGAYPGMKLLGSGVGYWNDSIATRVADSLLTLHPQANVVYAHNDRMAIAAADVARQKGLHPMVVGVDAAPEIGMKAVADGKIDATFLYPTEGNRLVQTALAIANKNPFHTHTVLPAASAVDISNADILMLQNESFQRETQKIGALKKQVDSYWLAHSSQTTMLYAALIILVLALMLLFLFLTAFWQKRKREALLTEKNAELEAQRDAARQLNDQLEAATQSKLMFFTNVSHDLRTPLTLIAEPVRQLEQAANLTEAQHALAKVANKNVNILRRLINQVLDFRKYENGKAQLNLSEVDICTLIEEWTASFETVARQRHLHLTMDCPTPRPGHMALDVEKIERVFFNVLSNAFKYTPDNGNVSVSVEEKDSELKIIIADSGRGISKEDLPNIFNRFFQVDKIHPNGSGIGLSLAKSFVELHAGSISVESEPGKGSVFTVSIPVRHVGAEAVKAEPKISDEDVKTELARVELPEIRKAEEEGGEAKPLVLVIDDNADIQMLVSTLLGSEYQVITASNGGDGLRMASKYVPDLVVCDVMMPGMDGMECCRRMKEELPTSHIPVLMLTACSLDEQRVQGYESGADGYVSKPFNSDVLAARCANLIANRKRIKNLFGKVGSSTALPESSGTQAGGKEKQSLPKTGEIDNDFYRRFIDLFRSRMGDAELSVDSLAGELGLGRSQFYRKIKALTNFSPVELMRDIRLKEGRRQLMATDKSISEIAYGVGFSTPAYFTKCYREAYGETPSETRAGVQGAS